MQTSMLGNNKLLPDLLRGPITDLLVKLNGERGQEVLNELQRFNRRETCWPSRRTSIYGLTVDYNLSIAEMVDIGRYGRSRADIPDQFRVQGKGKVQFEATLVYFDRGISHDLISSRIAAVSHINPWHEARIEHLLAFGASHPNEQLEHQIICTGSSTGAAYQEMVPYLGNDDGNVRTLLLMYQASACGVGSCILAVREQ